MIVFITLTLVIRDGLCLISKRREYMKEKQTKWLIAICILVMAEIGIYVIDQVLLHNRFIVDRYLLISIAPILLFLCIGIGYKKVFSFLFQKRYFVGLLALGYIVFNGYHGSSLPIYEHAIQPSIVNEENLPFIGEYRAIRSDEFLVDTPSILSQVKSNPYFSQYNSSLMAKESIVTLFPALPTKSSAVLLKPHLIGYLVLPLENAFSLAWFLPYFALFFGLFELFRKMTNDKRGYSLFGAMLLSLSPGILWWGTPQIFIYGVLATVFFSLFLEAKDHKFRFLYSLLLGWMGACFIATVYPAWMIPYGFLFLALFVWLFMKAKKQGLWKHSYFLFVIPAMLVIVGLVLPVITQNLPIIEVTGQTVYPGARSSSGGGAWQWLYHYIPSILYPFKQVSNASEFSQILSLYPLPILLGAYHCFKNTKQKTHDVLLNGLLIVTVGLTIWNYVDIGIFSKLTLLSMSTPSRSQLIASISCAFLLVVLISNYHEQAKVLHKNKAILSVVISIIFLFVGIQACKVFLPEYMVMKVIVITGSFYFVLFFLFLYNHKLSNYVFMGILGFTLLVQGVTISPITKGIGALYDKPLLQEIRKIVEEENDSVWLSADAPLHTQSAILANGAKVLNSTNYYPNFDFWYAIDPKKKNEDIYNRYSHVVINLVLEKTSFHLVSPDCVQVLLNIEDLKQLPVDYIVSTSGAYKDYQSDGLGLEIMYIEDGFYIYKVVK